MLSAGLGEAELVQERLFELRGARGAAPREDGAVLIARPRRREASAARDEALRNLVGIGGALVEHA